MSMSESDRLRGEKLYSQRASELALEATGVERLVYKILGSEFMGSIAFAIDPYSRFKIAKDAFAVANRVRQFEQTPFVRTRSYDQKNVNETCYSPVIVDDHPWNRGGLTCSTTTPLNNNVPLTSQDRFWGLISDTSANTRELDQDKGEFELFVPSTHSPSRAYNWIMNEVKSENTLPDGTLDLSRTRTIASRLGKGPAARIPLSSIDGILNMERTSASQMISNHSYRLTANCLALRPVFNMAYSLGEMRDLPRTLLGSLRLLIEARRSISKKALPSARRAAEAYLNWKFGWEPLLRDIQKLALAPERFTRRVNRLMERQGKDATFRDGFKFAQPWANPPGFTYDTFTNETLVNIGNYAPFRDCELRCVVNVGVQLPSISPPQLRRYLMSELYGESTRLSPELVYELVPWSWLVDWFGGLGDYVKLYDRINSDPSIVNWGCITYESKGNASTVRTGEVQSFYDFVNDNGVHNITTTKHRQVHTSRVAYKYQLRKSLAATASFRPTYELSLFSGDQLAVLGSLWIQRTR